VKDFPSLRNLVLSIDDYSQPLNLEPSFAALLTHGLDVQSEGLVLDGLTESIGIAKLTYFRPVVFLAL
jgi:hypothetical protein